MNQKTKLTVSGILQDLTNGLTRTTNSKNYNSELGCIQEKYNLTNYDLEMLFKHPKLKGKKTRNVRITSFVLEDDTANSVDTTTPVAENLTNILIEDDVENRNTENATNNVINVQEPVVESVNVATENTTELEEHPVEETSHESNDDVNAGW